MKTAFRLATAIFWLAVFSLSSITARGQFTYSTNYNGTLNLAHYTGTSPVVTIPSSSDGLTTGLTPVLWQQQGQLGITRAGIQSSKFTFTINGASNLVVVVEALHDLAIPNWVPVATNNLTGGSASFSDPQWMNYPVRFYRAQSQ